jgi:NAD(P)H dehydrogenase (quinone)
VSPANVLVIGATGATGSALVDALVPDHHAGRLHLVAATRRPEQSARLAGRGIEVRRLDLDEPETGGLATVRPAFAGIDLVFLLTGYDVRMLAQSVAAVDAARAEGVSHIVHLGVLADADDLDGHVVWHKLVEAFIERSGIGYTHLRPAFFMQALPLGVTAPGVFTHFIGGARLSWVDSGDIAEVAATVLRDPAPHAGRGYDLVGENASGDEIAGLLGQVTGRPWRYDPADPQAFYELLVGTGADPAFVVTVRDYLQRRRGGSLVQPDGPFGDIAAVTGRPATSVRQFLEKNRALFAG